MFFKLQLPLKLIKTHPLTAWLVVTEVGGAGREASLLASQPAGSDPAQDEGAAARGGVGGEAGGGEQGGGGTEGGVQGGGGAEESGREVGWAGLGAGGEDEEGVVRAVLARHRLAKVLSLSLSLPFPAPPSLSPSLLAEPSQRHPTYVFVIGSVGLTL